MWRAKCCATRGPSSRPRDAMPIFGTSAARFNDDGVTALYHHLRCLLTPYGLPQSVGLVPGVATKVSTDLAGMIPTERVRYLSDVSASVRDYHVETETSVAAVERAAALRLAAAAVAVAEGGDVEGGAAAAAVAPADGSAADVVTRAAADAAALVPEELAHQLSQWPHVVAAFQRYGPDHGPRRSGDRHPVDPFDAVRDPRTSYRLAAIPLPCRPRSVVATGESARSVPLHGRGLPAQTNRRGPGPHVRW